jgi:catechol 2,3-dioxygenase-like lactoylglutathione lyase family enzyme
MSSLAGLHHVATTCTDARRALDFYVRVLGLRLVKRAVGSDTAIVPRFYCGDATGSPGSLIALSVHDMALRGRRGTGQVSAATLGVPAGTLAYWRARLAAHGIAARGRAWMFGEEHLCFVDPDGLDLAIAEETARDTPDFGPGWAQAVVPAACAIQRIRALEIQLDALDPTAACLVEALGFRAAGQDGAVFRFRDDGPGAPVNVDLVCVPGGHPGAPGAGVVSHVAWRVADDGALAAARAALVARGCAVTAPHDDTYFRSIAFAAPGAVGFMLATDAPGFTVDEPLAALGQRLCLPPRLEPERDAITRALPPLA